MKYVLAVIVALGLLTGAESKAQYPGTQAACGPAHYVAWSTANRWYILGQQCWDADGVLKWYYTTYHY